MSETKRREGRHHKLKCIRCIIGWREDTGKHTHPWAQYLQTFGCVHRFCSFADWIVPWRTSAGVSGLGNLMATS